MAVPAALTYVPGWQSVHAVQLAALLVVLKVPLAQAAQVWSAVAVPGAAMLWPATQLVHATHAVDEAASSSHVPLAHACFGVAPPAQYVPASHAAHTGGEVGVPGEVCSVPASHAPCGRHEAWLSDDE
jgi:hypothetical protein